MVNCRLQMRYLNQFVNIVSFRSTPEASYKTSEYHWNVSKRQRFAVASRSKMAVDYRQRRDASRQTDETVEIVQDGAILSRHQWSRSSCMASG